MQSRELISEIDPEPVPSAEPLPEVHDSEASGLRSASRPVVESLLILVLGMLIFRTFAAEAYIVPTGSMAPTLLGAHQDVVCTECRFNFALGMDEDGHTGRPLCPNCGAELSHAPAIARSGDRLLVHKFLYDWRSPRRWEVIVFQNPSEPGQAYVKRVVGLPGDSVEIVDGDVVISGQVARKNLKEQRAMRILVHDSRFQPSNRNWFPRWTFQSDWGEASGWSLENGKFIHRDAEHTSDQADYIEYHHVDPDRRDFGPVRDFIAYNGAEMGSDKPVRDLMVEAEVQINKGTKALFLRFRNGSDLFRVRIPVQPDSQLAVWRNGHELELQEAKTDWAASVLSRGRPVSLEASLFDRRLMVALDGHLLFEPVDYEANLRSRARMRLSEAPLALGVLGGQVEVSRLKVYRDVFYTDGLSVAPQRPFGVGEPFQLDQGQYFVLGDNSPVSNDSRFWNPSPVVRSELLLGKPFLVHLPSRGVPLKVFGQETYWVPDLREIRYIR